MELQERIVRRLEDFLLAERGLECIGDIPFEQKGKEESAYPYIRALNRSLIHALEALPQWLKVPASELRFLEAGCGIGTKCELARLIGYQANGIDLLEQYVELARQVFPDCRFETANALDHDYAGFDIVYYHVPFFEEHLIEQLEERISSRLSAGSVLIATRLSSVFEHALSQSRPAWKPIECDADIGRLVMIQKTAD